MRIFKKTIWNVLFLALLVSSCDQVGDLIHPKKLPELDEKGIVLSRDQVMPLDTVQASIRASNPLEGPLQYVWLSDGGTFLPPSDNDTVYWVAPLSGGVYFLWVKVKNEDGETTSPQKQVNVISTSQPLVQIVQPAEGSYFVLSQECVVKVEAVHENGIALVSLLVNDQLVGQTDTAQNGYYEFHFTITQEMVGKTVLLAEAVARNQLQSKGHDSITIYVGGIVPGGNEPGADH